MSDRNRRIHCFVDVEIGGNSAGRIVLELFSDVCPKTCRNFVKLCNGEKVGGELVCYKGRPFSALENAVKVECICSSDAVHDELRNRTYPDEVSVLKHFKELLLTTANRGSDANGMLWMITTASTPELNSTHLVFGRVVSGQGVVEQIHATTKDDHFRGTIRARIGNCGELKPRSLDQRKPPAIYQTLTDFYNSRETSDESQEDDNTKTLTLASLFKRNNKLSRTAASASGDQRKIKGRGTVRYRGSSSRSQSESDDTPPHWRTELEKVKPLGKDAKEVPEDRWLKGDKLVDVESLSRKSGRYSRTESDDEDTRVHRRRSEKYSCEYEDDSDEESSSQKSRKKSTRYSKRYESDEEDSRSYRRTSAKYHTRRGESDEDRRSKKGSRNRSRSVEYDSSDRSPQRSIKKSQKHYSRRSDFESDEEKSRKFKQSHSSEYETADDRTARSKKKFKRQRARSDHSNDDSPGRSSRSSKKYSGREKYKAKKDCSSRSFSGSESFDSRTEESDDADERKKFTKRKTSKKKEGKKKKRRKHSKKLRDSSRETSSEFESERSRLSTSNSCDLNARQSESPNLKASRAKPTGRQDSGQRKLKARKADLEYENAEDFVIKINTNDSSLGHFVDAVKGFKKTSRFPECGPSGYSYKTEVKSSDDEPKTMRKSRKKEDKSYKAESTKLKTVGEKVKQKFDDSPMLLNSRTSKEKSATPKKSPGQAHRIEIVIPSSDEDDEENLILRPPLKKKNLKLLSLSDFNGGVAHASVSTSESVYWPALRDYFRDTEKRSRIDEETSGKYVETFLVESGSSYKGSSIRSKDRSESEFESDGKSDSDRRPTEMMGSDGERSEVIVEVQKSGSGLSGSTKKGIRPLSSSDDDVNEENKSLLAVTDKTIHSNKPSTDPQSFGLNFSLDLSKKYSRIKTQQLKNQPKEVLERTQSPLQQSVSSSSRLDNRDLTDQRSIVSKKQSDKKMPSSSRPRSSSSPEAHGGRLGSKSRSCSRTSSRRSDMSPGKHGRWSVSPATQRKKVCSYSSSSRSYSSRSESYRSPRTGKRRVSTSSSSGKSRSRTRSSTRSRSSVRSTSREMERTAPSRRLVKRKASPALTSVASVVMSSGNTLSVAAKNLSDSPPPSRWKPGQKPWKPKNILPASNSVAERQKMPSVSSALSSQRTDDTQAPQSQKASKGGRSSLTDSKRRTTGDEKRRGLKVRGQRRSSYNSEGSSQNSSSSRSVSKSRSYSRTDSDRSQSRTDSSRSDRSRNRRSRSRSDRSKSRSDWRKSDRKRKASSKSRSDTSKSRSVRRKSDRSMNERSESRSDTSKSRSVRRKSDRNMNKRSESKSDRSKSRSDRSKSNSHRSLYKRASKNSKTTGKGYYSRSDSLSRSHSQTSRRGRSRSRSTSNRTSIRSKGTDNRSRMIAGGTGRDDSRSSSASSYKKSYNTSNEKRHVVKKSSALKARSSRERSQMTDASVASTLDSDSYNKRAAVKLDKLKSVKKEKIKKKKNGSQVPWEPPVEPEYQLADTEDEGSKPDGDPNHVSIRKNKKWNKKGGDVTDADHDETKKTSKELLMTSDEKDGKRAEKEDVSKECSLGNDAMEQTVLEELLVERSGKLEDGCFVELHAVEVSSATRRDLSGTLECFKAEVDIIEVGTKSQSVNLEAEIQIIDAKTENQIVDVSSENQIADVGLENKIVDVETENQIVDVKKENKIVEVENQVAEVKAENQVAQVVTAGNQVAEVEAESQATEVRAANDVANVNLKNEVVDVNDENQSTDTDSQRNAAGVKDENLVAGVNTDNEMVLGVKADTLKISDTNADDHTDESLLLLLRSETKGNLSRGSIDSGSIDNILVEGAADQSDMLETEMKAFEAVNAEGRGQTSQKASNSRSALGTSEAENKEDPEVGSKAEILSASVVESAPKSQISFRQQHQSRSGPSNLPKSNLQDNRLLGKQLNFTWKSRSRLPVSGPTGVVRLNSPESPHAPVLPSTTSPSKLDQPKNVVDETSPVAVENSPFKQDKKKEVVSKHSENEGSEMVSQSLLKSVKSLQSPSSKRSASSSDDSSSRSSSSSSRMSISSSSSAHLERSPSARSVRGRRRSNSPSQSSRSNSKGTSHWSQASNSRSPSIVSARRARAVRTRSRSRTRKQTRSRTRSRSRRRTRSRTRSVSRRIRRRSRSQGIRARRSYSKRSSRSPRRRSSRSLTRRRSRSRSRRSRSRTYSRTPRRRLGRSRTRSRSRRSRTTSRRRSYSRQRSSRSQYDSRSRSPSRSRSYRRRRESSSQESYRQRRSSPSSRSRSRSSD